MASTATVIAPYHSVNLGGNSYTNITTNATTVIKSVSGVLHSITINTKGGTDIITVYDNSTDSGTKIATIDDSAASGLTLTYDIVFGVGLTIVTSGTTAPDITVSWR